MALAVGGVCLWTDVREGKIYNKITFPAMGLGLLANLLLRGGPGVQESALGLLLGLFLLFPCFAAGGVRAGDLKLLGAIGAWVGWRVLLWTVLATAIVGMLHALVLLLRRGRLGEQIRLLGAVAINSLFLRARFHLPAGEETYPYTLSILAGLLLAGFLEHLKGTYPLPF